MTKWKATGGDVLVMVILLFSLAALTFGMTDSPVTAAPRDQGEEVVRELKAIHQAVDDLAEAVKGLQEVKK